MEYKENEALVAATLAAGLVSSIGGNVYSLIQTYRQILAEFRNTGGIYEIGNAAPRAAGSPRNQRPLSDD